MEEKSKHKKPFKITNLIVGVFVVILIFFLLVPHRCPVNKEAIKIVCKAQLGYICNAVLIFKENNKTYPHFNDWCDTIRPYTVDSERNIFQCPKDKIGPCSYAMNENIPPEATDLPPDLVLLFEGAPGWNQVGGPEDVVTDRHDKPGANIAFADGSVRFVSTEDIPKLRWTK